MKPGESFVRQPVRSLQTMLRVLAEDDEDLYSLIPDGIYGPQTIQAVTAFQRKYGIPITGVTDQTTWERIADEHAQALVRVGSAQPLQLILNPSQVLRRGQTHPYLFLVQGMLTTLAASYGSLLAPAMTGILDEATAQSIIGFQALSQLPQTGELDKHTWKHLALQYPLAVNIQESLDRRRS